MSMKLENYLFLIAMRLIINNSKKKKSEHLSDTIEDTIVDESINVDKLFEIRYEFDIIQKLMPKLTEDQQNVLTLKYISDKDNSEIADILKKTKDNIRQIEHRALLRLNTLYKNIYEKES